MSARIHGYGYLLQDGGDMEGYLPLDRPGWPPLPPTWSECTDPGTPGLWRGRGREGREGEGEWRGREREREKGREGDKMNTVKSATVESNPKLIGTFYLVPNIRTPFIGLHLGAPLYTNYSELIQSCISTYTGIQLGLNGRIWFVCGHC